MQVLLINGSPKGKKSNTYQLATAFVEGMKKKETNLELSEIWVKNLEIKSCLGCFSCWNKTPGQCVIKDDMQMVLEKMLWADVVIWSFPLYYFNVPGELKTLIDRQLPMVLPFMEKDTKSGGHGVRYDMSQKRHVLVSTCGFYTAKGNYDSIYPMFNHFLGENAYETVFCGQGELFRVPELKTRCGEYLNSVSKAGEEFVAGKITEATKKELDTLLFDRETFETMADASWGVDKESGEKMDEDHIFTKQMSALYNKKSYNGKEKVLEMYYTDIEKRYQILMGENGATVIKDNFKEYTTRIETPYSLWCEIAAGKIRGDAALMQGKYKVKGDFDLMLHWDDYFGGADNGTGNKAGENRTDDNGEQKSGQNLKTNMLNLLIPWIAFWVAASINQFWGSLISILVVVLLQLVFYKTKKTVYDVITTGLVTVFSVVVLVWGLENWIMPISYLCFGLLWTVSCFMKIPLTAHYSANDYNGESALLNPLFIKTNWILTLMWGVLYLITAVMTYFIMKTSFASYLGIINNILPIFMGIFTGWFQKWYPAKVARG